MKIINARNPQEALPLALKYIDEEGIERSSRNGDVIQAPGPVTTVYTHPWERVIFHPERDANPFFHLFEGLWMLAGRNDVVSLKKFVTDIGRYSDDEERFHGAYGTRWRYHFGFDQLEIIANRLRINPDDRRCVLQMWNTTEDLNRNGKDIPCNLCVTFQINSGGALDIVVFCRSNDIIWGCYGSNVVCFSMLQDYMARKIGCPIGKYHQVSVNWHVYRNVYDGLYDLSRENTVNPYNTEYVVSCYTPDFRWLVQDVDTDFNQLRQYDKITFDIQQVLYAHYLWRTLASPERYTESLRILNDVDYLDWGKAGKEWIQRRYKAWEARMTNSTT